MGKLPAIVGRMTACQKSDLKICDLAKVRFPPVQVIGQIYRYGHFSPIADLQVFSNDIPIGLTRPRFAVFVGRERLNGKKAA